jgi:Tol biopolymer transport system component
VVYQANQGTATVDELYSVPIYGPAAAGIKVNGALVPGGNVRDFLISPNNSRVIYQADQETDNIFELYSVPLSGPATVGIKLNKALVASGFFRSYQVSPDSSRVVYSADQETATVLELYSVPLSGPATAGIKLNGALLALGNVGDFLISPDSSRVVYMADKLPRPQTVTVVELYSVPIGGPAAAEIKINGALVFIGNVINFLISPDSRRVVYRADQETDNVFELYSVPLGGPATAGIKINGALAALGNVGNFLISPDSGRVVYQANQQTATDIELYSVPLGGPAAAGVKLNGTLVLNGNVKSFQISPDTGRVLYIADQDTDNVFELYMTSNYLLHLPLILRQG